MRRFDPTLLRSVALAVGALGALSCSSSSGGSPPATSTSNNQVTLASNEYTLQPGDEKFYCYTMTLTKDVVATGFTPKYGDATHHVVFAETLAPEPNGFSTCDVFFKTTWAPLFVGGKGTTPLQLPSGTGMKLAAGTQILLQLHLLNSGTAPITDTTSVSMDLAADPNAPFTPAGIFGLNDEKVTIPPNSVGFQQSMPCVLDKPLDVFAWFGHMHRLGTHLDVTRNGSPLVDEDWNFDVQPTTLQSFKLAQNDQLKLTCTYTNTGSTPVDFGESTTNEMCVAVFYYTTFDGLDGCVQQ
jgi:hypothetical protein